MKKMFIPVLALFGMVACTNENEPEIEFNNNDPVEVKMVASIVDVNAKTRASVNTSDAIDVAFARINSATDPTEWKTSEEAAASIGVDGAITFSPVQYYPVKEAEKAYFIGYYPKGTLKDGTVTFSGMDGTQDILYAPEISGNKASTSLTATFDHKLAQLKFKFKKDDSFTSTATVSEITINGTHLPMSLDVATGTIAYATDATAIKAFTGQTYTIDGTTEITPDKNLVQAGASITLDITLSDGTSFTGITPDGLTTAAGTAHLITLTFKQKEVSGKATIAEWKKAESGADVQ